MTLLENFPDSPRAVLGDLPVTSRYTYGLAGERFFRAIKDDARLLGTRCPDCSRTYVPAVIFCERCLRQLDDWVEVGTKGEIHTFTLSYENYDGSRRDTPEIIAFIRLADGGIIHRLDEISPHAVSIGMLVEAVFKPRPEREGSILDITHFRPA